MNWKKELRRLRKKIENNFILMMLKGLINIFCFLFPFYMSAQGSWTQKATCPGLSRYSAVAFTIGNKGYLGTGGHSQSFPGGVLEDFWEYDPANNSWTQKTNFGGGKRLMAVGFSIGNYGYIGTGVPDNAAYLSNDFWKYDPSANTWVQVANFGGVKRIRAVGFSVGGKGYVGTGTNGNSIYDDFWQYDPSTDTWQQEFNLYFGKRQDIDRAVFVIGNKAYLGTGWDTITHFNDFWEYDPVNNVLTQMANLPGAGRRGATGFSLCGYGFLGLGAINNNNDVINDFWMFNPVANSWSSSNSFPGLNRQDQPSFVINNKAYIGTGWHTYAGGGGDDINDLWEYTLSPMSANVSGNTTICIGSAASLSAAGGINYIWSTGETTNTVNISPTLTTTYSVTVSTDCDSRNLTATVTVINTSNALFTYEYDPCKNNCVDFTDQSVNVLAWDWDFGDGQTSALKNECHYYNDSATYNVSLIINKATNCVDTLSIQVPYTAHDTSAFVYIPNAFSPNDDGSNDVLSFFRKDNYCLKKFEIAIYNRWGEKVFESSSITDNWDGRFNGKKLDPGVFVFYSKTITANGKSEIKKGSISLIK